MTNCGDNENVCLIPTNLGLDTLDMLDSWRDVGSQAFY